MTRKTFVSIFALEEQWDTELITQSVSRFWRTGKSRSPGFPAAGAAVSPVLAAVYGGCLSLSSRSRRDLRPHSPHLLHLQSRDVTVLSRRCRRQPGVG